MASVTTLTAAELMSHLAKLPSETKIYVSHDQEGNGYGTLSTDSMEIVPEDKAFILFPALERLDYDEICPKQWEKDSEEDERSID